MRVVATLGLVLLATACGAGAAQRAVIHLQGASTNAPTAKRCLLLIRQRVTEGGTSTYCLERFSGSPAPHAIVRDSGTMTFRLPHDTIRARVHVTVRFAADGHHAVQKLNGTLAGGGHISGGGTYVEDPPGHVASSNLLYVISK